MTETEPAASVEPADNHDVRHAPNGGATPIAKDLIAVRDGDRAARGRPTR